MVGLRPGQRGLASRTVGCVCAHAAFVRGTTYAHGDGSFGKRLASLAKTELLILDDWGLAPLNQGERNDLLEVLDDRVGTRSTLITSQLPVDDWHAYLNDPTLADAILDRVLHAAHKLPLSGEPQRKPETL